MNKFYINKYKLDIEVWLAYKLNNIHHIKLHLRGMFIKEKGAIIFKNLKMFIICYTILLGCMWDKCYNR